MVAIEAHELNSADSNAGKVLHDRWLLTGYNRTR
jgi:hypothetical protein